MDTIREGVIRIRLEQGTVELKAPDLAPVIAKRKEELSLVNDLQKAIEQGAAVEEKIANDRVAEINKVNDAAASALVEQEELTLKLAKSQVELLEGVTRLGTGFLSLGRSVALFTSSSDEDLKGMIQTLATFQAGFDLLRGSADLFAGTVKVLEQLQNARKLAAAATTAETTAITANTAASTANASAQTGMLATLAATNPILLAIAATLAVAAVAWKLYGDSVEDAAEAERKAAEDMYARLNERDAALKRNSDSLRDFVSEQERAAELQKRIDAGEQQSGVVNDKTLARRAQGIEFAGDAAFLERQGQTIQTAVEAQRELLTVEKQKSEEKARQLDQQAREIESQQRIVEASQKALEIEQKKVQAFEAQFGALNKGDQKRLEKLGNQLRDGGAEGLKRSDLEFLSQSGGDQGRQIAQAEFARRGREQGADKIFAGIANPALDQATSVFEREQKKLNDLTGGKSADDALSAIEDEKKQLTESLTEFTKAVRQSVEPMVETLNSIAEEMKKIKASVQNG